MSVVFGRAGPARPTRYWAVQLRRRGEVAAVAGRYLCHEPNAAAAKAAAQRLAKARGAGRDFTVTPVDPPLAGWGETVPPQMGRCLEVTNHYLWSRIIGGRQMGG